MDKDIGLLFKRSGFNGRFWLNGDSDPGLKHSTICDTLGTLNAGGKVYYKYENVKNWNNKIDDTKTPIRHKGSYEVSDMEKTGKELVSKLKDRVKKGMEERAYKLFNKARNKGKYYIGATVYPMEYIVFNDFVHRLDGKWSQKKFKKLIFSEGEIILNCQYPVFEEVEGSWSMLGSFVDKVCFLSNKTQFYFYLNVDDLEKEKKVSLQSAIENILKGGNEDKPGRWGDVPVAFFLSKYVDLMTRIDVDEIDFSNKKIAIAFPKPVSVSDDVYSSSGFHVLWFGNARNDRSMKSRVINVCEALYYDDMSGKVEVILKGEHDILREEEKNIIRSFKEKDFGVLSIRCKGDCTIVKIGGGFYVIDAGECAYYFFAVMKYLEILGVKPKTDVEYWNTHNHQDHNSGIKKYLKHINSGSDEADVIMKTSILEDTTVVSELITKTIIQTVEPSTSSIKAYRVSYKEVSEKKKKKDMKEEEKDEDDTIDDYEDYDDKDHHSTNKKSIVFDIGCHGKRCLITGDAFGSDMVTWGILSGKIDLLKAPHHGSLENNEGLFDLEIGDVVITQFNVEGEETTIQKYSENDHVENVYTFYSAKDLFAGEIPKKEHVRENPGEVESDDEDEEELKKWKNEVMFLRSITESHTIEVSRSILLDQRKGINRKIKILDEKCNFLFHGICTHCKELAVMEVCDGENTFCSAAHKELFEEDGEEE